MTDLLAPAVDGGPVPFDDDELTAQALAADPDAPIAADAVSLWDVLEPTGTPLLPQWYMPAATGGLRHLDGWPRKIVFVLLVAFVAIDAGGLCFTYGII